MTLLAAHEEKKAKIAAALEELAAAADAVGMTTLAADLRGTRLPKLKEGRFNLVVLGEFNHGKSTFVNALLGGEYLPTGITPTTAAINHVVWAETARARAILDDGSEKKVDPKKINEWVTAQGKHVGDVHVVELGVPAEILKNAVTLVDTPGVNDLNDQRAEITYGYVPRADAVLFLLDAGQALKESERAFLTSRLLERSRERMIFVLGKADLLAPEELREVTAYVRQHLQTIAPGAPVFVLSAKKQLQGDAAAAGFGPLLEHLGRFLDRDRARIVLDNAVGDGLGTAAYVKQSVGVRRSALALDVAELEERVAKLRVEMDKAQQSLGALIDKVGAEAKALKARVRYDLEDFVGRFVQALPAQIDAADAGDVKRYLHLFVEAKVREWAEREGEQIGGELEKLAEEVISVTAESTRTLGRAVGDRLGVSDARIELDVDSFGYDVSVYAVGAVGTGVLLFVNTLAGGLLTLAAPILAIVFNSKVAAELKAQAKERAPDSIRRAAAVMGPHLEKVIDDHGKRLADFVASAGDTLFKGLTELFDRAILERKAKGAEVGPLIAEADALLEKIDATAATLAEVRTALWG